MPPNELLMLCRPGFEADLAAELQERIQALGEQAEIAPWMSEGLVRVILADGRAANDLHRQLKLDLLVFARQTLVALPPLQLSRDNRLSTIVDQLKASGWSFEEICQETPDTNEARALSGLLKALERPLSSQLKKAGALRRKAGGRRLHLVWRDGDQVQAGISFPGNRSEFPGGIRRLRFPPGAPSRSTLKLEEAWHEFVPQDQWQERIAEGMQAADLGAAPGGWSWQLVQRGMQVYAIDNGPMDRKLMATGMVEHLREDGFVWTPPMPLDWLVSDIVDKPARVISMVERWLLQGWCREAIFNLKLPMKKRWEEVARCLEGLTQRLDEAGVSARIRCRHLYHDREEVTVHVQVGL